MRIAPYGRKDVFVATLLFAGGGGVLLFLGKLWFAIPSFLLWGFIVYFFRDPHRQIPDENGCLVSPADGTVMDIVEMEEDFYLKGKAVRIGIFLSGLSVHVNRSPAEGTVEYSEFRKGKFYRAFLPMASEKNQSHSLGLVTSTGLRLMVKQLTGGMARRIVCVPTGGETLERGELFGMIKLGSRTELYIPVDAKAEILVKVGDKVFGGETILANVT